MLNITTVLWPTNVTVICIAICIKNMFDAQIKKKNVIIKTKFYRMICLTVTVIVQSNYPRQTGNVPLMCKR